MQSPETWYLFYPEINPKHRMRLVSFAWKWENVWDCGKKEYSNLCGLLIFLCSSGMKKQTVFTLCTIRLPHLNRKMLNCSIQNREMFVPMLTILLSTVLKLVVVRFEFTIQNYNQKCSKYSDLRLSRQKHSLDFWWMPSNMAHRLTPE